jgi:putative SOS response-associated peptidase YedK
MKWGLIPSFAKDQKWAGKTFNCRKDTLLEGKSIWAHARKDKRCLVFIEGYYEWLTKGKAKIPYYVKRKDGRLMCIAGLWEKNSHVNDSSQDPLYSFTIITTDAHKGMSWLHSRMPLVVDPDNEFVSKWLDPSLKWGDLDLELAKFLQPFDSTKLEVYEVSTEVNRIGTDSPTMNQPIKKHDFFNKPGKHRYDGRASELDTKKPKTESESDAQHSGESPNKSSDDLTMRSKKEETILENKTSQTTSLLKPRSRSSPAKSRPAKNTTLTEFFSPKKEKQ